jgi:hypothetical protein
MRIIVGEMCSEMIPVADPLVIITGQGKHSKNKKIKGEKKKILQVEVKQFLAQLGLRDSNELIDHNKRYNHYNTVDYYGDNNDGKKIEYNHNPGRIIIPKIEIIRWLNEQREDDKKRKSTGQSVHGNLFIQVSKAKRSKEMNVRAVCPFSSATSPRTVPQLTTDNLL